ncbi:MAG: FAD-dependent thymidylate synthase [Clostridia bacterium]|nr:FAD-dependent thymidylate synthase [Clostridia bacterium]
MERGSARIILNNEDALRVVASSARISTQQGTALEIYGRSGDREKDLKLVGKVLSSGHKSVIEHQTVSIAFDDVSVLVEQFVIEFRLASYTVKSRRYVDFSDAGYVVPEGMPEEVRAAYCARTEALFGVYERLLELGIPKEDARFVLPYGFRSNFFATMNARELISMVSAMIAGRGSCYPELKRLGMQIKEQFDALYPGVIDGEMQRRPEEICEGAAGPMLVGTAKEPEIRLVSAPANPEAALDAAMRFGRRFGGFDADNMKKLMLDARPRELEILQYSFRIDNVSLACVTHFTRHRMLSLQLRHELSALSDGNYVLPESISANAEANALYCEAFAEQTAVAERAKNDGAGNEQLAYFAMAGHVTSILITMNARELLHFAKLRSCSRAQWEIRGIARAMIELLNETEARGIFQGYGPTCAVTGKCPEGKMSCGRPVKIENGMWKE